MRQLLIDAREKKSGATGIFLYRMYDYLSDEAGRVAPLKQRDETASAINGFSFREQIYIKKVLSAYQLYKLHWSQIDEDRFKNLISSYFSIGDKKEASDYGDAEAFPIFLLKKAEEP